MLIIQYNSTHLGGLIFILCSFTKIAKNFQLVTQQLFEITGFLKNIITQLHTQSCVIHFKENLLIFYKNNIMNIINEWHWWQMLLRAQPWSIGPGLSSTSPDMMRCRAVTNQDAPSRSDPNHAHHITHKSHISWYCWSKVKIGGRGWSDGNPRGWAETGRH